MNKITIVLLFTASTMWSQSFTNYKEQLKNIAPSSPQAAAFLKYGEVPVSLYTGVPNISIPLYTIRDKDIEVPVVLSYHASGIKVDEEATFVGLGWSLSAGGSVIQNIANRNDFGYGGYYFMPENTIPKLPVVSDGSGYNCEAHFNNGLNPYILNYSTYTKIPFQGSTYSLINPDGSACIGGLSLGVLNNYDDYEPDLFQINLPNSMLKAYLDKKNSTIQNKPVFKTVGQYDVKMDFLGNYSAQYGNAGFNITTDDGIKYEFTETEVLKSDIGAPEINSQTSYLSKIRGIYNNEVSFTYINSTLGFDRYRGSNRKIHTTNNFNNSNTGYLSCFRSYGSTKYMDEILFSEGKLKFSWSSREDLKNGKKLDKIEIFDKKGNLVKKFDFVYGYFISNDAASVKNSTVAINGFASKNPITHRLKLVELKDSGESQSHKFEYEETIKLPAKTSFAVDYWGYYNGQANDSTFVPNTDRFLRGTIDNNKVFKREFGALTDYSSPNGTNITYITYGWKSLADRRTSNTAKANMLKKIIYPTKGYTEFEFESNSFSNYPLQSLINDNTLKSDYINFFIDVPYFNNFNGVKTFSVTDNATPMSISASFDFYFQNSLNGGASTAFWVYVKNIATGVIVKKIYNPNIGNYSQPVVEEIITLSQGNYEIGYNYDTLFSDHLYNVMKAGTTSNENPIYVRADIIYSNKTNMINGINYNLSYGGGVRVKKITTSDGISAPLIKEYLYDDMNGSEITSNGKLMELPSFYKSLGEVVSLFQTDGSTYSRYRLASPSSPSAPLLPNQTDVKIYEGNSSYGTSTTSQGNFVGYSKVIEKTNNGSNGYIERRYTNSVIDDIYGSWNFGKYQYLDNGNLVSEKYFDSNGALKKEITNTYGNAYDDPNYYYQIVGIKTMDILNYSGDPSGSQQLIFDDGKIYYYPINLYRSQLNSTTEKEYLGGQVVETATSNTYNSRHQLKETQNVNSNNAISIDRFYYPNELATEPLMSQLIASNRINSPVKQEKIVDSAKLSENKIAYAQDAATSSLLVAKTIYSAKFPNSLPLIPNVGNLEKKITYDRYDDRGNILQYTTDSGVPVSIIWGYGKTKPIAKIENLDYASIPSGSISSLQSKSDTDTEASLLSDLNALRASFPNSMVTTFTYRPLIGVSTITDAKGDKFTYDYDIAGRLKTVRDKNNNILSENDYHYKP